MRSGSEMKELETIILPEPDGEQAAAEEEALTSRVGVVNTGERGRLAAMGTATDETTIEDTAADEMEVAEGMATALQEAGVTKALVLKTREALGRRS